jgi:NADP-dependent aldehyde dehydrogenase
MSSINPMVLLPNILAEQSAATATSLAGSITLGVGQFCTNPGLIFVIQSEATDSFITQLVAALSASAPGVMLNQTICKAYYSERKKISGLSNISALFEGVDETTSYKGSPALYKVSAAHFINEPMLQEEIFGPASLIVVCSDKKELELAIKSLRGQLTGSIFGTKADLDDAQSLANILQQKVGRLIFNAVPTGVEVCHAMVHGGPFPSTSDARTTSVGTEAIRRFVRPVCYQDAPSALLPIYLRNENEASIMRKVNGVLTRDAIV